LAAHRRDVTKHPQRAIANALDAIGDDSGNNHHDLARVINAFQGVSGGRDLQGHLGAG
jgi:hypothetical protein